MFTNFKNKLFSESHIAGRAVFLQFPHSVHIAEKQKILVILNNRDFFKFVVDQNFSN
jgi:hypothetical protein